MASLALMLQMVYTKESNEGAAKARAVGGRVGGGLSGASERRMNETGVDDMA